ncbi:hypothetical protein glysoja_049091 [Glycine soja]|uniref:Uncharacterized protein n=1 Tax=Glycine soja TaxID=3848 RepID=A0A0B2Q861_GLYSO|nr:hypothetical protein glysoja_049091 [Glycine soja]
MFKLNIDGSSLGNPVSHEMVSSGVSSLHPYAALVDRIYSFKNRQWNISFTHTYLEGNGITN